MAGNNNFVPNNNLLNLVNDIHRLKFEKPGNYSILIEIDDQVVLASTFPITQVS